MMLKKYGVFDYYLLTTIIDIIINQQFDNILYAMCYIIHIEFVSGV